MKVGRLSLSASYIVNLDNEKMVTKAKHFLFEDLKNMSNSYDEFLGWVVTEKDTPFSKADIPDFLLEFFMEEEEG